MEKEKVLEVKKLQVSFRTNNGIVRAVRDISFDLYKGETLAIVGESGSGKSVTSKAILGILSGNAIVDGGEVLYDGNDLLKITEDELHKLRGDKIAMIFQDPLSSLDPVVKIGRQLTEAMLLKNIAGRKNAKKEFNTKLKELKNTMVKSIENPEQAAKISNLIKTFDNFNINALKLENDYNNNRIKLEVIKGNLEGTIFSIENKQEVELKKVLKSVVKEIKKVNNYFVLKNNKEKVDNIILMILNYINGIVVEEDVVLFLSKIVNIIKEMLNVETPNFFRIGYYLTKNDITTIIGKDLDDIHELTYDFLMKNFMNEFLEYLDIACKYAFKVSNDAKKESIAKLNLYKENISNEDLDKKSAVAFTTQIIEDIRLTLNHLSVERKTILYTFDTILKSAINTYFKAKDSNAKEEIRYAKEAVKYNSIVAAGKTPDFELSTKNIINEKDLMDNILDIVNRLIELTNEELSNFDSIDYKEKSVELIDYFKEKASAYVYVVTPEMAKERVIEIMDEVGIPEPRKRFNQYPFQFSGGMRQRIVIAIALAADPDLLICDEPTTALDVTIQAQILELINKLKVERGLSIIFITHDLGVVANMADRIAVMYAGKIVETGTVDEIFYEPAHPYTWALLSSMPDLDTDDKLEAIPGTPPNMIYPPVGDAFAPRNKYAMKIDFEKQPDLFKITDTHFAATWLLHPDAPKVEMPKVISDRIARMKALYGAEEKTTKAKSEPKVVESTVENKPVIQEDVKVEETPKEEVKVEETPVVSETQNTENVAKPAPKAKPATKASTTKTAKPAEAAAPAKSSTTKPKSTPTKKVVKKTTTTTTITKKAGGTTTTVVETKESTGGDVNE